MKITIDTFNKTIELDESIQLKDFISKISEIVPNWEEYTLIPKIINQSNNWPYTFGPDPVKVPYNPGVMPVINPSTNPFIPQPNSPFNPPYFTGDPLPGQNPTFTSENKQCKCN